MPGKPLDPSRVHKRQFELKMKLKLKEQGINYGKLSEQEKIYFRLIELRKRQNRNRCPSCYAVHFASPPDECWLYIARCENSELRQLFEAYVTRNKWAQF